MGTRIANRVFVMLEVSSRVVIIIVMGTILTIIGASIYEMLGTTH